MEQDFFSKVRYPFGMNYPILTKDIKNEKISDFYFSSYCENSSKIAVI